MIILMTCFVILAVSIAGCTSQAPAASPAPVPAKTLSAPDPSEMLLQVSDLPANFTLVEKTERNASEMRNWSLGQGWKKGYYAVYQLNDKSARSGMVFEHVISVYPAENISLIVPDTRGLMHNWSAEDKNMTVEELSLPTIGDSSCSFRVADSSDNTQWYQIAFAKNDVYMELWTNGTATDYETLKHLADTAVAKIR
jgi:hypothetical protein